MIGMGKADQAKEKTHERKPPSSAELSKLQRHLRKLKDIASGIFRSHCKERTDPLLRRQGLALLKVHF